MGPAIKRQALTLVVSGLGVGAFMALSLPLPFLFGPMAACLIASLAGAPLRGLGQVSVAARSVLGVAVGASITPELAGQIPAMAYSIAIVPVYVIVIGLIGVPFFRRVCGFDSITAFYSAMPGGAADMTIFGQEAGANVRQLSLVHVTRLLVIMVIAPIVLVSFYKVELNRPVGAPASELPLAEMLLMFMAAVVGWKGGERVNLFGAAILGPLIVAAVLSLSGYLHARPPKEILLAAQFLIGAGIGVSYVGVTFQEIRQTVVGAGAFVVILAGLAALVTEFVTIMEFAPPVEAFLAFAPGGQAEMSMLTIVAGADLGFVVAHHLARIVFVILGAPVVARSLAPTDSSNSEGNSP